MRTEPHLVRRIRFHHAQRAELQRLVREAERLGDAEGQRVLLQKIDWVDRQLKHLRTVSSQRAA